MAPFVFLSPRETTTHQFACLKSSPTSLCELHALCRQRALRYLSYLRGDSISNSGLSQWQLPVRSQAQGPALPLTNPMTLGGFYLRPLRFTFPSWNSVCLLVLEGLTVSTHQVRSKEPGSWEMLTTAGNSWRLPGNRIVAFSLLSSFLMLNKSSKGLHLDLSNSEFLTIQAFETKWREKEKAMMCPLVK